MNYVKVVSIQIAEVGYEPDIPEPGIGILGLRFPPNKKQVAAGQPGSEYHSRLASRPLTPRLLTH